MRSCEIKINPGWFLSETDEETCAVRVERGETR